MIELEMTAFVSICLHPFLCLYICETRRHESALFGGGVGYDRVYVLSTTSIMSVILVKVACV